MYVSRSYSMVSFQESVALEHSLSFSALSNINIVLRYFNTRYSNLYSQFFLLSLGRQKGTGPVGLYDNDEHYEVRN